MQDARAIVAAFLGAPGAESISFRREHDDPQLRVECGIGRTLNRGDEVLITQLDHEANRGPWLTLKSGGVSCRKCA